MRYKATAKCVAWNHLVKNRWRISLRSILPDSLYFFLRYNAWGRWILTSQTFLSSEWQANEPNHWWKSSALFRTKSQFACLLTPSESWGPHTHGIRSTSNSNNALKHWTYELHCCTGSTINPPRNTLQRAVVWGWILLLFCPFLGRVAPRPPWHKSRKTQAKQKSLNRQKNQIRADHKSRVCFPRHRVVKGVPFGTLHCKIPILFIAAKKQSVNSRFTVPQVLPAWSDWHPHSVLTRAPLPSIGPQDSIHELDKNQKQIAYNGESITILTVWLVL